MEERRLQILRRVEQGELSLSEAVRLLSLLEEGKLEEADPAATPLPEVQAEVVEPQATHEESVAWKWWRWIPMGLSILLTVSAATWLLQAWQQSRFGLGFWLAWIPLAIGIAGLVISVQTRWLHVRIYEPSATGNAVKFVLHLPLPIQAAAWVMRNFGQFVPAGEHGSREQILAFLDGALSTREPIQVTVDEEGTKVDIWVD